MADVPWFDREEYPLVGAAAAEWEGFVFVNLAKEPEPLEQALSPLLGRFAPWRLPSLRSVAADRVRRARELEARLPELLGVLPLSARAPGAREAVALPERANDLREGSVLGGVMLINEKGGSISTSGRMCGVPLGDLSDDERQRVYYYSVFPGLFLTVQPDFAMVTRLEPQAPDRTRVVCEWLFAPATLEGGAHRPDDGIEIWDATNRQDWHICELAQQGVASRAYRPGLYSREESLLAAFDREYRRSLEG